jgi:hypothetical protein
MPGCRDESDIERAREVVATAAATAAEFGCEGAADDVMGQLYFGERKGHLSRCASGG